ncbi:MAG: glycosyltransferase family 2 protein [Promethearchaeota archaeon]
MKISIIIPAHNEEDSIGNILDEIVKEVPQEIIEEIIVVNDHSIDKTGEIIEKKKREYSLFNIKQIYNDKEPGFANALKKGYQVAKGNLVLHLMGDGCDNIGDITLMFEKFKNEHVDMVCGSRYVKGGERQGGSFLKGFFSRFVGVSLHYIIGIPTRDVSNAFKMYREEILNKIFLKSKGFEVSMELGLRAYLGGFKICEIPTVWKERSQGSSDFKVLVQAPAYIKLYLWAVWRYIINILIYL